MKKIPADRFTSAGFFMTSVKGLGGKVKNTGVVQCQDKQRA